MAACNRFFDKKKAPGIRQEAIVEEKDEMRQEVAVARLVGREERRRGAKRTEECKNCAGTVADLAGGLSSYKL
jgi:hypothetical protein